VLAEGRSFGRLTSSGAGLLAPRFAAATANLPVPVLFAPLAIDMIQPFLIFTALLIIAAVVVVGLAGSADLFRSQRKQTSHDVPTGSTTVPAT
jgi:hypothetical protein